MLSVRYLAKVFGLSHSAVAELKRRAEVLGLCCLKHSSIRLAGSQRTIAGLRECEEYGHKVVWRRGGYEVNHCDAFVFPNKTKFFSLNFVQKSLVFSNAQS